MCYSSLISTAVKRSTILLTMYGYPKKFPSTVRKCIKLSDVFIQILRNQTVFSIFWKNERSFRKWNHSWGFELISNNARVHPDFHSTPYRIPPYRIKSWTDYMLTNVQCTARVFSIQQRETFWGIDKATFKCKSIKLAYMHFELIWYQIVFFFSINVLYFKL